MRQNDISKLFNHSRWATPIICGLLLGSAGDFAMKFLRATQRSSDPTTTADPRRDPIPQIQRGIPGIQHQREVDHTGAVRCRTDILMSGCCDTRYWDRYDNNKIVAVVDRQ